MSEARLAFLAFLGPRKNKRGLYPSASRVAWLSLANSSIACGRRSFRRWGGGMRAGTKDDRLGELGVGLEDFFILAK